MRPICYTLYLFFFLFQPSILLAGLPRVEKLSDLKAYSESPLSSALKFDYGYLVYGKYQLSDSLLMRKHGHSFRIAFEAISRGGMGKWTLGGAVGFYQGLKVEVESSKIADLYTYPVEIFATYRMDFSKNQLLVPFVRLGGAFTWVRQVSLQEVGRSEKGALSWEYSVGLALCLNPIDSKSAEKLDTQVGINNTYLEFEYVQATSLSTSYPDVSHYSYRLGFRFEI